MPHGPPRFQIPPEFDGYRLTEQLGAGGLGAVFRAEAPGGDPVAIKILSNISDRSRARFQRELELGRSLEHPNLVRTLDGGQVAGAPYLVLELIPGEDLAALLRDQGPMEAAELRDIADQLTAGLAYLHGRGLVHRDLKPENLRLRPDGTLKILDLGLMHAPEATALTATGTVLGTFLYMAPEQLAGGEKSPAMDLYAVGVLLYKLLTGAHPLHGEGSIRLADYLPLPARGEVLPWREGAAGGPLDRFFHRCLHPDPDRRPPEATALAEQFTAALAAEGLLEGHPDEDTAPLPGPPGELAESTERLPAEPPTPSPSSGSGHHAPVTGAAELPTRRGPLVGLVLALLLAGAWWALRSPPPPELELVAGLAVTPEHRVLVLVSDRPAVLETAAGQPVPRDARGRMHYVPVGVEQEDVRLVGEAGDPLHPWSLSTQRWRPVPWVPDQGPRWEGAVLPEGATGEAALPTPEELLGELARQVAGLNLLAWIEETQETGRSPARLGELLVERGIDVLYGNAGPLLAARLRHIDGLRRQDLPLWYAAHDLCLAAAYLHRTGSAPPVAPLRDRLLERLVQPRTYTFDGRPPPRPGRVTFAKHKDFFLAETPRTTQRRDAFEDLWFQRKPRFDLAVPEGSGEPHFEAVLTRATVFALDYFAMVQAGDARPVFFFEDPTGPGGQVEREPATKEGPQLRRQYRVTFPEVLLDSETSLQVRFRPWVFEDKHAYEHVVMQAFGWGRGDVRP